MEIKVLEGVLASNEALAQENAKLLAEHKVFAVNLMASPGAGKTSFIVRTIEGLRDRFGIAVIEGDIASKVDAELIGALGIPSVQINTGGACHLEAKMIQKALGQLDLAVADLLIIENVGNLVCPVDFQLGENTRVMILSVPEGDDKPLKYPPMFSSAEVLIINKMDLIGFSDFDLALVEDRVKKLNPNGKIIPISCKTGEGLDAWLDWLVERLPASG